MISLKQKELLIISNIKEADLVTHSGTFHSDEVFSTVILKNILDKEPIKICRISEIKEATDSFIYDIGGGKYDHHQPGGNGQRKNGVKYSSFGLIWRDYGKEFLNKIGAENIVKVWEKIDKKIVQAIDAVDNGQLENISNNDFEILNVSNLISVFNSNWEEEDNQNVYFLQAVEFAQNILYRIIVDVNSEIKAVEKVEEAIKKSNEQILILDKFMPWKETLLDSTNLKAGKILYVIFPSNRGGYNIYSVPKEKGSFESRKLFPKEWAGLKDNELQKATGVETAFFCHNGRFICCTRAKEDAIKLAKIAIEYRERI